MSLDELLALAMLFEVPMVELLLPNPGGPHAVADILTVRQGGVRLGLDAAKVHELVLGTEDA